MTKEQQLELSKIISRMVTKEQSLATYPDSTEDGSMCMDKCPFSTHKNDFCTRTKGHTGPHVDYGPMGPAVYDFDYTIWSNEDEQITVEHQE